MARYSRYVFLIDRNFSQTRDSIMVAIANGMSAICFSCNNESNFLALLQSGNQEAYSTLVRTHSNSLRAIAKRYLSNEEDIADAIQETFLSAFRSIQAFQGTARLSTWLHRIIVNCCLMKLRKKDRLMGGDNLQNLPDDSASSVHEDSLLREEMTHRLRACINRLPDPYRTIIVLRDLEGRDTQETAYALGVSCAVVKTRLHRARQSLRLMLVPEWNGMGI